MIHAKQRHYIRGKRMHMSDTISAAFCDLSEISCHWGSRSSQFNSAGDCHVPDASVTVSSCLRARETYLNKWAQASPVGDMYCTAPGGLLTMLALCLHNGDAVDMWTHYRLTQSFTQESKAKSDLHHMWRTYDGSKLICDAWLGWVLLFPFVSRVYMWTHGCSCSDLCCCSWSFRLNFCFIVLKAFTNCWSSYFNLQVWGFQKELSLFFERKCLSTYLSVAMLDMFFAYGDSRNGRVSGIISVLWSCFGWRLISWNSIKKLYFHFCNHSRGRCH